MKKVKNRIIGDCDYCGKELHAFGTPFVVEPYKVIYKRFFCHTINPETNCLYKHWGIDQTKEVTAFDKKEINTTHSNTPAK
jgi:hypothetical protein